MLRKVPIIGIFLSTLSLRRATLTDDASTGGKIISIHALLAESDIKIRFLFRLSKKFLSTLSLRRATGQRIGIRIDKTHFYPRSPCGERHRAISGLYSNSVYFYPRSPCGERHPIAIFVRVIEDFYPRSPCGERPWQRGSRITYVEISIHALLAESDATFLKPPNKVCISIHALLAESDDR